MARTLSRKGAIRKLDGLVRDIIWSRDKSTCRKCGIVLRREDRQGNVHHVIPKKRGYHVRWVLDNCILLCETCHFWWHSDPTSIIWLHHDDQDACEVISELNHHETEDFKQNDLLDLINALEKRKKYQLETNNGRKEST